jgi:hypothetical protein
MHMHNLLLAVYMLCHTTRHYAASHHTTPCVRCSVVLRPLLDEGADLRALLERRMLQLVGTALREAPACAALPALAGYRLDRLRQDFEVSFARICSQHV